MRNSFRDSSGQHWEEEIKAYQEELRLYGHEMTVYERNIIQREIRKRQDELIPVVGAQIIGEFDTAIKTYQGSLAALEEARKKEINRFDAGKLNAEMQLIQTRVELAMKQDINNLTNDAPRSKKFEAIYQEAMKSGDIHRQRAAVEVIKSLPLPQTTDVQERIAVDALARQAGKVESQLRTTPEIVEAHKAKQAALYALGEKRAKLERVSTTLGMGHIDDPFATSPFAKAARRVQFPKKDDNGETHSEVQIFEKDSPEVTGVMIGAGMYPSE